jgi:peptidyl-prolyl cis-trans isomerase SurA
MPCFKRAEGINPLLGAPNLVNFQRSGALAPFFFVYSQESQMEARVQTMHRFSLLIWMSLGLGLILTGCAGSGTAVVATIGKEPLTLEDFEASYAKNNGGWEKGVAATQEERERFLDLLVKFRLKVAEATERGLLADSAIKSEMEGYKIAVATSFMLEREIIEPRVRDLYNRKTEEIRASHVLFRVNPDASPADTLAAYQKAMKVIDQIPTNRFDTLAVRNSEDPSVSANKGDLGYFSSGRMVPEFEDGCYQLKPGEYTPVPVRSQFGYHIIKVTSRQKSKGSVRVSHILWRGDASKDSLGLKDSVWNLYKQLKAGLDFAAAAKQYSQDPGSNQKGGDIGFYERGRIMPEIENLFYSTALDSVTEPFRMPYGYHIFKVTGYSGVQPYEEIEKDLRQNYQQTRYNTDYENYVRGLKKRYKLLFDEATSAQLTHAFDTMVTPTFAKWSDTLAPELKTKVLFKCENRPYTVEDFVAHVNATADFKSSVLDAKNVQNMINRMGDAKLVEEHARQIPERYASFNKLLKEYQDGILLYRIEQDEIWKKVVVNDSLLQIYYNENMEKFRWPERVNFTEIYLTSDSLAQVAYKQVLKGKNFSDVAEQFTMRQGYKEKKGEWGFTPNSLNEVTRYAAGLPVDSIAPPFANSGGWSIVKVLGKDTSHVKSFEESTPELLSAYQENAAKVREQEWLSELKTRFPIILRKELLPQAFKGKPVDKQ